MTMRFVTLFLSIVFAVIAAGAAPAAHAQSCPSGCVPSGIGGCVSSTNPAIACPTRSTGNTTQTRSTGNSSVTLLNPLGEGTSINSFLLSILKIITNTIGPVIVILMMVFVGFKFVTARGEPAKITEARQMLLWTVVGALILLGAQVIAIGIKATVEALSTGG